MSIGSIVKSYFSVPVQFPCEEVNLNNMNLQAKPTSTGNITTNQVFQWKELDGHSWLRD